MTSFESLLHLVVVCLRYGLQVLLIPEERHVPTMWNDVVNDSTVRFVAPTDQQDTCLAADRPKPGMGTEQRAALEAGPVAQRNQMWPRFEALSIAKQDLDTLTLPCGCVGWPF